MAQGRLKSTGIFSWNNFHPKDESRRERLSPKKKQKKQCCFLQTEARTCSPAMDPKSSFTSPKSAVKSDARKYESKYSKVYTSDGSKHWDRSCSGDPSPFMRTLP